MDSGNTIHLAQQHFCTQFLDSGNTMSGFGKYNISCLTQLLESGNTIYGFGSYKMALITRFVDLGRNLHI